MSTWGYGKHFGPETWPQHFPTAGGQHQSPINIVTDTTEFDGNLERDKMKITFHNDKAKEQVLSFHGHNFYVHGPNESTTISRGPAAHKGVFKFAQLHFHWGKSEKDNGSEHTINGHGFASELHIVHYNSTRYKTFEDALSQADGLIVLGILIKVGEKNCELEKLIKPLSNIRSLHKTNLHDQNSELNLRGLLPHNIERYYTYSGSLTTPPCYESVTWVVFDEPITMSSEQLLQFRDIHIDDECGTSENFRPVCPLHNRKVKKSFK